MAIDVDADLVFPAIVALPFTVLTGCTARITARRQDVVHVAVAHPWAIGLLIALGGFVAAASYLSPAFHATGSISLFLVWGLCLALAVTAHSAGGWVSWSLQTLVAFAMVVAFTNHGDPDATDEDR